MGPVDDPDEQEYDCHKVEAPFEPLDIKIRTDREYRCGRNDPTSIEQAFCDSWDRFVEKLEESEESEQEAIKNYFNEFKPGQTEALGDAIFGFDLDDFRAKLAEMSNDNKTKYFTKLIETRVLDEDAGLYKYAN